MTTCDKAYKLEFEHVYLKNKLTLINEINKCVTYL